VTSSAIPYLKIIYPIRTWGLPPRLGPRLPPSKSRAAKHAGCVLRFLNRRLPIVTCDSSKRTCGQARNQRGSNRAIAPPKFSQTYVFVRCSKKSHHFVPFPKISVGCGPACGCSCLKCTISDTTEGWQGFEPPRLPAKLNVKTGPVPSLHCGIYYSFGFSRLLFFCVFRSVFR